MRTRLRPLPRIVARFIASRRGVAAVEFALVLPVMALMYLGGFQISQEIAVNRQVVLTASTVASIVTQYSSISQSTTMPGILAAASAVLTPYSASNATVTVSCVQIDSSGKATILWSVSSVSGAAHPANSSVTLPASLDTPNSYVVWGETTYAYTPVIDYLHFGTTTLYQSVYMLPRQPGVIALTT